MSLPRQQLRRLDVISTHDPFGTDQMDMKKRAIRNAERPRPVLPRIVGWGIALEVHRATNARLLGYDIPGVCNEWEGAV